MDAVERPDQLHAGKVFAAELWGHGLQLRAVKQAQERGFDHVGKVVAQGNFIAAQLLGLGVQTAPPHPGAEVTGVFVHLDRHVEDIAFKQRQGDAQTPGALLQHAAVCRVVARVHSQEGEGKGPVRVLLQLLHQLGQDEGVLPAGDAHGDMVPRGNQLIPLHSGDEGIPQGFSIGLDETALGSLLWGKLTGHM